MKRKSLKLVAGILSAVLLSGCVTKGLESVPGAIPAGKGAKALLPSPKNPTAPKPGKKSNQPKVAPAAPAVEASPNEAVAANEVPAPSGEIPEIDAAMLDDFIGAEPVREAPEPVRTWVGTPPLALQTRDWGSAEDGFRYFAAEARKAIADGNTSDARRHAALAENAAKGKFEKAEARALHGFAELLDGRDSYSITAGLDRPSADWRAAEVARRGIAGRAGRFEVKAALGEIRTWPSPVAGRVVQWLASAAREHPEELREITAFARDLNAAHMLGQDVMAAIEGYAPKAPEPEAETSDAVDEPELQPVPSEPKQLSPEAAALLLGDPVEEQPEVVATSKSEVHNEIESANEAIGDADSLIESFNERIQ